MEQDLIEEYFEGVFQDQIEEAMEKSELPSPEEAPFDNKYLAREIQKKVLDHDLIKSMHTTTEVISLKGVLFYLLGLNAFETEENGQAREYFRQAIDEFEKLPYNNVCGFQNILQEIFNSIGLLHVNSDSDAEGVGFLSKAFKIYEKIMERIKVTKETYYFNIADYSKKLRDFNSGKELAKKYQNVEGLMPKFCFYYKGGLNLDKAEEIFTQTNFYLAQCYTKYGLKDDAAYYCGQTLKRQLDLKEYESQEWSNSSMGLAEYYKGNHQYSQAMYVIFVSLSILPEGKKKKTRASLNIMMGNIVADFLEYNTMLINLDLKDKEQAEIDQVINNINRQSLVFEDMNVTFPKNTVYFDAEGVKVLFRMALTEYKKALSVYKLDGYVTEHIQINKQISGLYKKLSSLEPDQSRQALMLLKRRELIQPLVDGISPKAYIGLWRECMIEYGEILYALFELRYQLLFGNDADQDFSNKKKDQKKLKKKLDEMNGHGLEAIDTYSEIYDFFQSDDYNEEKGNNDYIQSIVNIRFNNAKIYSKIHPINFEDRIRYLEKSLENYKFIQDFITKKGKEQGHLNFGFSEQLTICKEMCQLLPVKIDKIKMGFLK